MKRNTEIKLRKLVEMILKEEVSLQSSEAYKIFKKFGARYGSIWAKTDEQDERIDQIYDALFDAGFQRQKDDSMLSYESYLIKGDEVVYYNARTGYPGLQAIGLITPRPPERPAYPKTPKSKPEFGNSNRGNLERTMYNDLQISGLSQWTAEQWKKSAIQRGTFDTVDAANVSNDNPFSSAGAKMADVWPARFHQIMKLLIKKGKVKMEKIGGKNVYSLI